MDVRRSDVEHIARWVENDSIAMSHQSLGVYRRELLKTIRAVLAEPEKEAKP